MQTGQTKLPRGNHHHHEPTQHSGHDDLPEAHAADGDGAWAAQAIAQHRLQELLSNLQSLPNE